VGKNIRPQEMQAIVRKRKRRILEEEDKGMLAFRVRGIEVEERKIERYIKEKDIPENAPYSSSPSARMTPGTTTSIGHC
jgi:hypothetical protein